MWPGQREQLRGLANSSVVIPQPRRRTSITADGKAQWLAKVSGRPCGFTIFDLGP